MSFRLVYLRKPITLVIRNGGSNCFALSGARAYPSFFQRRHRYTARRPKPHHRFLSPGHPCGRPNLVVMLDPDALRVLYTKALSSTVRRTVFTAPQPRHHDDESSPRRATPFVLLHSSSTRARTVPGVCRSCFFLITHGPRRHRSNISSSYYTINVCTNAPDSTVAYFQFFFRDGF